MFSLFSGAKTSEETTKTPEKHEDGDSAHSIIATLRQPTGDTIHAASFSHDPDNKYLAWSCKDNIVAVRKTMNLEEKFKELPGQTDSWWNSMLCFSYHTENDAMLLAAGGKKYNINVFEVGKSEDFQLKWEIAGVHNGSLVSSCFSRFHQNLLFVCCRGGVVSINDVKTQTTLRKFQEESPLWLEVNNYRHLSSYSSVQAYLQPEPLIQFGVSNSSGKKATTDSGAGTSYSVTFYNYNVETKKEELDFCLGTSNSRETVCFKFLQDGHTLATTSHDQTSRFFDLLSQRQTKEIKMSDHGTTLAMSRNEDFFAVACFDHHIRIFSREGEEICVLKHHTGYGNMVLISNSGLIMSSDSKGEVVIWGSIPYMKRKARMKALLIKEFGAGRIGKDAFSVWNIAVNSALYLPYL